MREDVVLKDAVAVLVHEAEHKLASAIALLSRQPSPPRRLDVVLRDAFAALVHFAEVVLGAVSTPEQKCIIGPEQKCIRRRRRRAASMMASRAGRSGFCSVVRWSFGVGLPGAAFALFEAVAVAVHLEDVDVVGQAVEERTGQPLGGEHAGPLVERQV